MLFLQNIEFYNTPDGAVMVKEQGHPVKELLQTDRDIIEPMLAALRDRYPIAFSRLSELYSKSETNRWVFEYKMIHRFCRCNFGEYDQCNQDIDASGIFHFEEVRCPLRGCDCLHEGVICKPELNTVLTEREKEVTKLIADGYQTQDIADLLYLSVATVNRHRENIKAKLCLRNIAEIASYYHTHLNH